MYVSKRHRHTFRLKDFDYSSKDIYHVTVVAQERNCVFGEIIYGKMKLSSPGIMIEKWIQKLPSKYPGIMLDQYVVMPNHVHFILIHMGADLCESPNTENEYIAPQLSQIIQWFKTMTTNDYIKGVKSGDYAPFIKRLWQRNYYERIIRDYEELKSRQDYINNNPVNWDTDKCNPQYGPYYEENAKEWVDTEV